MRTKSGQTERWITRQVHCRPRTRRYGVIALLLCLISLAAIHYLNSEIAGRLRVADAACWLVLAITGVALLVTLASAVTEKPRLVRHRFRDPNYKLSEL